MRCVAAASRSVLATFFAEAFFSFFFSLTRIMRGRRKMMATRASLRAPRRAAPAPAARPATTATTTT